MTSGDGHVYLDDVYVKMPINFSFAKFEQITKNLIELKRQKAWKNRVLSFKHGIIAQVIIFHVENQVHPKKF